MRAFLPFALLLSICATAQNQFGSGTNLPFGGLTSAVTAIDLNADYLMDIVQAGQGGLVSYLSQGNGTFGGPNMVPFPSGGMALSMAAGDISGD